VTWQFAGGLLDPLYEARLLERRNLSFETKCKPGAWKLESLYRSLGGFQVNKSGIRLKKCPPYAGAPTMQDANPDSRIICHVHW